MAVLSEDILASLIERTLKAGASQADARLTASASLSAEVRNGELESVEREESRGIALRALVGLRQAHVSATDLSPDSLKALSERVVAMARQAPEDRWCGLADATEISRERPRLDLECDDTPDAAELEARARAGEAAALAVEGVAQVGHAGASWSSSETYLAASNGFFARQASGYVSTAVMAIAARDGAMERDYDSHASRRRGLLEAPELLGRRAGERAVQRLSPRKLESQTATVIFENREAGSLLSAFLGAVSGPAVARGVSFLKDKRGEQVFAKGVNIVDDPLRPGGYGSRGFDGEGRPVGKRLIVEDGRLVDWLLNGPSARQLGLSPNGFASLGFGDPPGVSPSNLELQPGASSLQQLMADAGSGLFVTDMFGPSLNANTGDYSVGVSGMWFEGGELAYPVSEVTVAGDLISMFLRAQPGSDLDVRSSVTSPSLLIEGMMLAGR